MQEKLLEQIAYYNQMFLEREVLYRQIAAKAGVTETAFWIMFLIDQEENVITQSDICRERFYAKQTINSAVDKLMKQGLLLSVYEKGTGHRKALRLTEKGMCFCEKWIAPVKNADYMAFEVLSEKERAVFLELKQKQLDCFKERIKGLIDTDGE